MSPDSAEVRIARIEEHVRALQRAQDSLVKIPGQTIEHSLMLASLDRHIKEARAEAADDLKTLSEFIAKELEELREAFKAQATQRAEARVRISLAVIAGSFAILASVIAAAATILGGAP